VSVNQQLAQSATNIIDRLTYQTLFGDSEAYTETGNTDNEAGNLTTDGLTQTIKEFEQELKRVYYVTFDGLPAAGKDGEPVLYKMSTQVYGKEFWMMHPDNFPAFEQMAKEQGLDPVEFDINAAAVRKAKERLSRLAGERPGPAKSSWL
jgi:hypothetical protein